LIHFYKRFSPEKWENVWCVVRWNPTCLNFPQCSGLTSQVIGMVGGETRVRQLGLGASVLVILAVRLLRGFWKLEIRVNPRIVSLRFFLVCEKIPQLRDVANLSNLSDRIFGNKFLPEQCWAIWSITGDILYHCGGTFPGEGLSVSFYFRRSCQVWLHLGL